MKCLTREDIEESVRLEYTATWRDIIDPPYPRVSSDHDNRKTHLTILFFTDLSFFNFLSNFLHLKQALNIALIDIRTNVTRKCHICI